MRVHLIFLGDHVLNFFPWTHRSITSMRGPIIFPAATSTKIGATVTKLTTIESDCMSGSSDGR